MKYFISRKCSQEKSRMWGPGKRRLLSQKFWPFFFWFEPCLSVTQLNWFAFRYIFVKRYKPKIGNRKIVAPGLPNSHQIYLWKNVAPPQSVVKHFLKCWWGWACFNGRFKLWASIRITGPPSFVCIHSGSLIENELKHIRISTQAQKTRSNWGNIWRGNLFCSRGEGKWGRYLEKEKEMVFVACWDKLSE